MKVRYQFVRSWTRFDIYSLYISKDQYTTYYERGLVLI